MAGPAWATPTRRAMRWGPLLVAAPGFGAVAVAMWVAGARVAEPLEMIAVAVLVAAAALALDDPAHALVAAAPCGFARRLAHRLAWLAPATVGCLLALGWIVARHDVASVSGRTLAQAAALGSLAVMTHALVMRQRPDIAASAAAVAPAVLVTFAASTPRGAWGGSVTHVWLDRPWAVVGFAAAVVLVEIRR